MTSECVPQQGPIPPAQSRIKANVIKAKRRHLLCLALLIGLSALLDGVVTMKMSATVDESWHLRYATHILQWHPDRRYKGYFDSQMPISALNAIPGAVASALEEHHSFPGLSKALSSLYAARFPTILATLALNVLVYLWAYDLYGGEAALAACLLSVLSPNLIAHGTLATTDMYHSLGVVGALYFFRRFLLKPSTPNAVISSLVLALAQITKPFALSLYAVVGVVLVISTFRPAPVRALAPKRLFAFVAIAAAAFVAIINIAYCFDRPFTRLDAYAFENPSFVRIARMRVIHRIPVPLPYPFLQGLDMISSDEKTGATIGNIYLLGELGGATDKNFHGFKSYYAVGVFFKEPIALLVLFICGIAWICKNRTFQDFVTGEGLLLGAAAVLFSWLSLMSRAQIGLRHILPALAIETVIAGASFHHFSSKPRPQKVILSLLVLWMAISVGSYYPNMIPYMNEWVHDRRLSYEILADSNLDWGQDTAVVNEFLRKNPDVILDPQAPQAGRILVSANRLTGVDRWNPSLHYFAQHYQPVAQVGYAHFLFVVPAGDMKPTQR